jgi:hypothetical protein
MVDGVFQRFLPWLTGHQLPLIEENPLPPSFEGARQLAHERLVVRVVTEKDVERLG